MDSTEDTCPYEPYAYRVVVCCVTTEVNMVVSPILKIFPNEVHLYRYIRNPGTPAAKIYEDHYREVLKRMPPEIKVFEHDAVPVYDNRAMVSSLNKLNSRVMFEHPDADIMINISSGPNDYALAVGQFSSMNPHIHLFKVSTREYSISEEEFIKYHYCGDGTPRGLSRTVNDPKYVTSLHLYTPPREIILGLRLYAEMFEHRGKVGEKEIIKKMKALKIWTHVPENEDGKAELWKLEHMYYRRNYFKKWKELGWIEKLEGAKHYTITAMGLDVIDMFPLD